MTAGELKTRTLERLDESSAQPAFYTPASVLNALNEAQRVFALLTLCVERRGVLELFPGQTFYHLLDEFPEFLLPLRASVKTNLLPTGTAEWNSPVWDEALWDQLDASPPSTAKPLRPARIHDLDARNALWQTTEGEPERYGVLGLDLLFLDKRPAAAGSSLLLTFAAAPTGLAADGDVPEIPEEYHHTLIDWAIVTLRMNEGGQELAQAMPHLERFLAAAAKLAAYVRARYQGLRYDALPFELAAYDRSTLLNLAMPKEPRERKPAA